MFTKLATSPGFRTIEVGYGPTPQDGKAKKTRDCTLILLLAVIVPVRGFPMDTQSYGLFFLFLCFLNSASRSDERLFMLYSFFFFTFSFFFSFRLFKRKIPLWATCTTTNEHAEETPRHGAFFHLEIPSVIISGASRAGEEERNKKIGDDKVARLSVLHDFFLFLFFQCLRFNALWQYGFITE